jgi:hypothetical protein
MDLKEIGLEVVGGFLQTGNKDEWRAFVNELMSPQFV